VARKSDVWAWSRDLRDRCFGRVRPLRSCCACWIAGTRRSHLTNPLDRYWLPLAQANLPMDIFRSSDQPHRIRPFRHRSPGKFGLERVETAVEWLARGGEVVVKMVVCLIAGGLVSRLEDVVGWLRVGRGLGGVVAGGRFWCGVRRCVLVEVGSTGCCCQVGSC